MDAPVIRRQAHGIKVQQITITLPGDEMARLRREAHRQGITVSRHVVNLIQCATALREQAETTAKVA